MRIVLVSSALLALAACHNAPQPAANETSAAPEANGKGVDRSHEGAPAPQASFNDPNGKAIALKAFAGKPTLVNLWATWCAPCVKELPTLDQLARSEGGELNVVAISQDDGPHPSVEAFLKTHQIEVLKSYQDPPMALSGALNAEVLPTSVLYDAQGKEVWRFVGDEDWSSPEAAKLLGEAGAAAKGS